MKVKQKNNKGITLLVLVITIIILLILAGITISALTGENGLISRTKQAKEKTFHAQNFENSTLSEFNGEINSVVTGSREQVTVDKDEYENLKNKVNALTTQNTMSSTEHFSGEYYYNGKPIYEKTVYVASLPNTTGKMYDHGISDVDTLWFDPSNCFGVFNSSGDVVLIPFVSTGNAYIISLVAYGKKQFKIETLKDRSIVSAYITMKYTKTTDTANSNTLTTVTPN